MNPAISRLPIEWVESPGCLRAEGAEGAGWRAFVATADLGDFRFEWHVNAGRWDVGGPAGSLEAGKRAAEAELYYQLSNHDGKELDALRDRHKSKTERPRVSLDWKSGSPGCLLAEGKGWRAFVGSGMGHLPVIWAVCGFGELRQDYCATPEEGKRAAEEYLYAILSVHAPEALRTLVVVPEPDACVRPSLSEVRAAWRYEPPRVPLVASAGKGWRLSAWMDEATRECRWKATWRGHETKEGKAYGLSGGQAAAEDALVSLWIEEARKGGVK